MSLTAKFVLLFALGVMPATCAAKEFKSVIPCARAAFSQRGDLVEFTANGQSLDLEVTRANGARESGKATIRTDQYGDVDCSLFISSDDNLAAAITRVPLQNSESVRVWDVAAAKWQSSFVLEKETGLEGRISVLGFWKNSRDLAVESDKLLDKRGIKQTFALALVNASGKIIAGPKPVKHSLVDVKRGRLWTASGGWSGGYGATITGTSEKCYCAGKTVACSKLKTPCLYREVTLGDTLSRTSAPGPARVPCDCFGGSTSLVGFPGANRILGAEGLASYRDAHEAEFEPGGPYGTKKLRTRYGTVVSVCNVSTNGHERLVIPAPREQILDAWADAGPAQMHISSRGEFFAVAVQTTRWSLFDTQRADWNELHVFQTSPFREIGKVGPVKGCRALLAFAVGDRDGKVRVAMDWCGRWRVESLNGSKPEMHH